MIRKVLVANRGEIACRIIRTLDRIGMSSVAVYSEADAHAPHARMAGEAHLLGPAPASASYLNAAAIIEAARRSGADAIHPGYGFLSENPDFAEACEAAGLVFVGPTPQNMREFGLKHSARALAIAAGVPVAEGTGLLESADDAAEAARRIGYPVMIKSTAGGGGIGMRAAADETELRGHFEAVQRLAAGNFKAAGVFLEKLVTRARHIEVQIFGNGRGGVTVLGERDCSAQRRNQKVIEETPAPGLPDAARHDLHEAARRLGEAAHYRSAGTCEFLCDADSGHFFFLEVNARLQVEHCVTEEVFGVDLVACMLELAAGQEPDFSGLRSHGHAIQARLYAEDPWKDFQPGSGIVTEAVFPEQVRIETWIERGTEVTPHYDPLLAKMIVHGATREEALESLSHALKTTGIHGIETNLEYLRAILASSDFRTGGITTGWLSGFRYGSSAVDVLDPGTHSTLQDYPGRQRHWEVGVPPSGPMDHLALRCANVAVGNPEGATALECTVTGPTLRFRSECTIAIAGADMQARVDGVAVPMGQSIQVRAGQSLAMGAIQGCGCRTYVAVAGGFDVPAYMSSRSTFTLGGFGGHGGRILRSGDVLRLPRTAAKLHVPRDVSTLLPAYGGHWELGVLYGPHGAPDYFTEEGIAAFFATDWKVHYNSSRTGIRLVGPKPGWARKDGGEAGLHPSNIHDNAYAIGSVDFTGDMPVILGVDGPSLGGFVCPAVVVQAELWKMGQLRPGDTVRFIRWSAAQAAEAERRQETVLKGSTHRHNRPASTEDAAVAHTLPADGERPMVVYRRAGDRNLLAEYGPPRLDIELRFRVHALSEWLRENPLPGILDLTPGIRSLQIHFDSRILPVDTLLESLVLAESALPGAEYVAIPSRVVHLPLSWDDPATQLAIARYAQSVRPDAPWCPSNIEFIRRMNGLASEEDVRRIVFGASYLVMGLGDVYLGAPVATPLDPRHRLVTTKYNPARTWTPENAVGIGGAYLCVYGMEGPGGYQFVGRTIQMWNRWHCTPDFPKPWLLRHFDQIRFYPVEAGELLRMREDFPRGRFPLRMESTFFRMADYRAFLSSIAEEAADFKVLQQAAFDAERERWEIAGDMGEVMPPDEDAPEPELQLPPGAHAVDAHVAAHVWKLVVEAGSTVMAGEPLLVLEAMKMEMPVVAPVSGRVLQLRCTEGQLVTPGQTLVVLAGS